MGTQTSVPPASRGQREFRLLGEMPATVNPPVQLPGVESLRLEAAAEDHGVARPGLVGANLDEFHIVLPAVAEVVLVAHTSARPAQHLGRPLAAAWYSGRSQF